MKAVSLSTRRRFLGAAAMTLAAGRFGSSSVGNPQSIDRKVGFGVLKQIDAGVLSVGYADTGPADGRAVVLLHGWPYDIHTYVDVAPRLASAGYRVIVPYLRGYGTTRFLSGDTARNGQQSALAADTVALMDALRIDKAIVAGCDWGARAANIVAALWPERCKALVSVSGYLIGSREANRLPLAPKAELQWRYQDLLRDGSGPRRIRTVSPRVCQAHLGDRLAEMAVRRRHVRSNREGIRQSGPCRPGDSQLSVAARVGGWRVEVPTSPSGAWRPDRRSPCPPSRSRVMLTVRRIRSRYLCEEVLRQVRASPPDRRHRAQFAAGGSSGVYRCGHRRGSFRLIRVAKPGRRLPRRPSPTAFRFDYLRSDLKPARISSERNFGCSQAAKCPPLGSVL